MLATSSYIFHTYKAITPIPNNKHITCQSVIHQTYANFRLFSISSFVIKGCNRIKITNIFLSLTPPVTSYFCLHSLPHRKCPTQSKHWARLPVSACARCITTMKSGCSRLHEKYRLRTYYGADGRLHARGDDRLLRRT